MQELTITDLESGQRLNKYMMKYLNQAPSSFIYKMLRTMTLYLAPVISSTAEEIW